MFSYKIIQPDGHVQTCHNRKAACFSFAFSVPDLSARTVSQMLQTVEAAASKEPGETFELTGQGNRVLLVEKKIESV